MAHKVKQELEWCAPSSAVRRDLEGDTRLALVATDLGVHKFTDHFTFDDPYGEIDVTVDTKGCIVFTVNGGGIIPYEQWTALYYCETHGTPDNACKLAELAFSEIVAGTMTADKWQALGFTFETV